jgi:pSer/pThr/pTyr-binding forkhead associated (FHA) protein
MLQGIKSSSPFVLGIRRTFCRILDAKMTFVTLKALEGMERGNVYLQMPLPVSIGREEENVIQLNDDRVSRFHAKLQDHSGRVILTDLDSTNGTRVNGHPIQMRVMQNGDVISIGRCVLLFNEVKAAEPRTEVADGNDPRQTVEGPESFDEDSDLDVDYVGDVPGLACEPGVLFPQGRPEVPQNLTALQRVQLSDLLSYVHEQLGLVVKGAVEDLHATNFRAVRCDWETWMRLTTLQSDVAGDIREIHDPDR